MTSGVRRQAWLVVAGTMTAVFLALGTGLSVLDQRHEIYRTLIHQHEQRMARLQGLRDSAEELESLANEAETRAMRLARDPRRPEHADLNLLRTVQTVLRDAGLSVERSQEQPRREHEGFTVERLSFLLSGTLPQLLNALTELQGGEQSIRVESLRIAPTDVRADQLTQQRIQIFLDVALAEVSQ